MANKRLKEVKIVAKKKNGAKSTLIIKATGVKLNDAGDAIKEFDNLEVSFTGETKTAKQIKKFFAPFQNQEVKEE